MYALYAAYLRPLSTGSILTKGSSHLSGTHYITFSHNVSNNPVIPGPCDTPHLCNITLMWRSTYLHCRCQKRASSFRCAKFFDHPGIVLLPPAKSKFTLIHLAGIHSDAIMHVLNIYLYNLDNSLTCFLHIAFLHCNVPLSYSNVESLYSISLLYLSIRSVVALYQASL